MQNILRHTNNKRLRSITRKTLHDERPSHDSFCTKHPVQTLGILDLQRKIQRNVRRVMSGTNRRDSQKAKAVTATVTTSFKHDSVEPWRVRAEPTHAGRALSSERNYESDVLHGNYQQLPDGSRVYMQQNLEDITGNPQKPGRIDKYLNEQLHLKKRLHGTALYQRASKKKKSHRNKSPPNGALDLSQMQQQRGADSALSNDGFLLAYYQKRDINTRAGSMLNHAIQKTSPKQKQITVVRRTSKLDTKKMLVNLKSSMSFNGSLRRIDDSDPISKDTTLKSLPQSHQTKTFRDALALDQQRIAEYQASGDDLDQVTSAMGGSRERNPLLYEEHDGSLQQSGSNQFQHAKQMLNRDASAYLAQNSRKLGESFDGRSYPLLGAGMNPTSTTSLRQLPNTMSNMASNSGFPLAPPSNNELVIIHQGSHDPSLMTTDKKRLSQQQTGLYFDRSAKNDLKARGKKAALQSAFKFEYSAAANRHDELKQQLRQIQLQEKLLQQKIRRQEKSQLDINTIHHSASISKGVLRQASTRNGQRNTKSQNSNHRQVQLAQRRDFDDTLAAISVSQNLKKGLPDMNLRTPNRVKSHLNSTGEALGNTASSVWTMNGGASMRKGKSNRANSNAYGLFQPVLGPPSENMEQRDIPRRIQGLKQVNDKFSKQVKKTSIEQPKQISSKMSHTQKDWSKFKNNMQTSAQNDTTMGTMSTLHRHADSRERLGTSNASYVGGAARSLAAMPADRIMTVGSGMRRPLVKKQKRPGNVSPQGYQSLPRKNDVSAASAMGGCTEPGVRRKRDESPGPEYGQAASALSVPRSSQESFVKDSNELSRIQFIRLDDNSVEKSPSRKPSAKKTGRKESAKSSGRHDKVFDVHNRNGAVQLTQREIEGGYASAEKVKTNRLDNPRSKSPIRSSSPVNRHKLSACVSEAGVLHNRRQLSPVKTFKSKLRAGGESMSEWNLNMRVLLPTKKRRAMQQKYYRAGGSMMGDRDHIDRLENSYVHPGERLHNSTMAEIKQQRGRRPGEHPSEKGNLSEYTKHLYRSIDIGANRRANSARPIRIKGVKHDYHLIDVGKYGDKLKYGVFNWPVRFCTLGRRQNRRLKQNPERHKEELVNEIHFDTLYRILKQTDWSRTLVYEKFIDYGRWKHTDDSIYSEIELAYLKASLHKMASEHTKQEFDEVEGRDVIAKHWAKVLLTYQRLMNQMNMMYFYERVKLKIAHLEKPGQRPRISHLEKLMSRCQKLYHMIDQFMNIFKLIKLKEKMDNAEISDAPQAALHDSKKQVLFKRLTIAICLLLKENPVLPLHFNFRGECLIERLKMERQQLQERVKARRQATGQNDDLVGDDNLTELHTKLVNRRRNHPADIMSDLDHDSQLGGPSAYGEDVISAGDNRQHELAKVRIKKKQTGETVPV